MQVEKIEKPSKISIEYCKSCETHNWCTHHNEERYKQAFLDLAESFKKQFGDVQIVGNEVPSHLVPIKARQNKYYDSKENKYVLFPAIGAFEVYFDDQLIFSKKNTNTWPNNIQILNDVFKKIHGVHRKSEASQSAVSTEKYGISQKQQRQTVKMANHILQNIDKNTTFYREKAKKQMTLTDHFKRYKMKKKSEQDLQSLYAESESLKHHHSKISKITPQDIEKLHQLWGKRQNLPNFIKNKAMIEQKQGRKQMLVNLSSIEEQNQLKEVQVNNIPKKKNKNKISNLQIEFEKLEKKFLKFQCRVSQVNNKNFDICALEVKRQKPKKPKYSFVDKINEIKTAYNPQKLVRLIKDKKKQKIQEYIHATSEQKNQKLEQIYGPQYLKPNLATSKVNTNSRVAIKKKKKSNQKSRQNTSLSRSVLTKNSKMSNQSQNRHSQSLQEVSEDSCSDILAQPSQKRQTNTSYGRKTDKKFFTNQAAYKTHAKQMYPNDKNLTKLQKGFQPVSFLSSFQKQRRQFQSRSLLHKPIQQKFNQQKSSELRKSEQSQTSGYERKKQKETEKIQKMSSSEKQNPKKFQKMKKSQPNLIQTKPSKHSQQRESKMLKKQSRANKKLQIKKKIADNVNESRETTQNMRKSDKSNKRQQSCKSQRNDSVNLKKSNVNNFKNIESQPKSKYTDSRLSLKEGLKSRRQNTQNKSPKSPKTSKFRENSQDNKSQCKSNLSNKKSNGSDNKSKIKNKSKSQENFYKNTKSKKNQLITYDDDLSQSRQMGQQDSVQGTDRVKQKKADSRIRKTNRETNNSQIGRNNSKISESKGSRIKSKSNNSKLSENRSQKSQKASLSGRTNLRNASNIGNKSKIDLRQSRITNKSKNSKISNSQNNQLSKLKSKSKSPKSKPKQQEKQEQENQQQISVNQQQQNDREQFEQQPKSPKKKLSPKQKEQQIKKSQIHNVGSESKPKRIYQIDEQKPETVQIGVQKNYKYGQQREAQTFGLTERNNNVFETLDQEAEENQYSRAKNDKICQDGITEKQEKASQEQNQNIEKQQEQGQASNEPITHIKDQAEPQMSQNNSKLQKSKSNDLLNSKLDVNKRIPDQKSRIASRIQLYQHAAITKQLFGQYYTDYINHLELPTMTTSKLSKNAYQLFSKESINPQKLTDNTGKLDNILKMVSILCDKNQYLIVRLFQNCETKDVNTFGIWLCQNYCWKCFWVQKSDLVGKKEKLVEHSGGQLWGEILVLALVQMYGGFDRLSEVPLSQLFHVLTGSSYLTFKVKQDPQKNNKLLKFISQNQKKNFILVAQKRLPQPHTPSTDAHPYSQTYFVLSQKLANNEILLRMKKPQSEAFWIKLQKFVTQFSQVDILQLRVAHNFGQITLESGGSQNYVIVQMEFKQQSFGCVVGVAGGKSADFRMCLYREEQDSVLRLVGQLNDKNKKYSFFDCCFQEGRYFVFTKISSPQQNKVCYLGEGNPKMQIKQQIQQQSLKSSYTQYIPLSNMPAKRPSQQQIEMPKFLNMTKKSQKDSGISNGKGYFKQSRENKQNLMNKEQIKAQFVKYLVNG